MKRLWKRQWLLLALALAIFLSRGSGGFGGRDW